MKNGQRIEAAIRAFAWVVVPDDCIDVEGHRTSGGTAACTLPHESAWATDEVTLEVVRRLCPCVTCVSSEYEAKAFMAYVTVFHGIGASYSPSTPFSEYVNDYGQQLLDDHACETLDVQQSLMFACLGESRPWELAVQLLYELFGPSA